MTAGLVVSGLLHVGLLSLPLELTPSPLPQEPAVFTLEENGVHRWPSDQSPRPPKPLPAKPRPRPARGVALLPPIPSNPRKPPELVAPPIPPEGPIPSAPRQEVEANPASGPCPPARMAALAPALLGAPANAQESRGGDPPARMAPPLGVPPTGRKEDGGTDVAPAPATPTPTGPPSEVAFASRLGPRFVHREVPPYPLMARRLGKEGKVLLRLTIDETGRLVEVDVLERADYGFTESALQAVKRSTFTPAMLEGRPIASRAILPVRFELRRPE